MNPQMPTQTQLETSTYVDSSVSEIDLLSNWGFDAHQIASLLWLRLWYQNDGKETLMPSPPISSLVGRTTKLYTQGSAPIPLSERLILWTRNALQHFS